MAANQDPAVTATVKHIVMWKVSGDSSAERAAHCERVKREFESLRGLVSGLLGIEWASIAAASTRPVMWCCVLNSRRMPRSKPMPRTLSTCG